MPLIDLEPLYKITGKLKGLGATIDIGVHKPANPFLVQDDETPGTNQLHESEFFELVITQVVKKKPLPSAAPDAVQIKIAVFLSVALAKAARSICSFEGIIRNATGHDADEPLDPAVVAAELADVLAAQITKWQNTDPADEDSYSDDSAKSGLLREVWKELANAAPGAVTWGAVMPKRIRKHLNTISLGRPGSSPSFAGLGRRVHTYVQLMYRLDPEHLTNHIICDGRWYYTALTIIVSDLVGNLTASEIAEYTKKILVYNEAMKNPAGAPVRPDIFDLDSNTVYEIKARAKAYDAYAELYEFYIPRYNRLAAGSSFTPPVVGGSWTPPPVYFDIPSGSLVMIHNVGYGAIIYDVYKMPDEAFKVLVAIGIGFALLYYLSRSLNKFAELPPLSNPDSTALLQRALIETILSVLVLVGLFELIAAFTLAFA